jgi:hypothetical protein
MKNMLQKASIASIAVVLFKTIVGGLTIKLWDQTLVFTTIDPGLVAAILTPTLGAFVTSLHDRFEDADGDGKPDAPAPPAAPKP